MVTQAKDKERTGDLSVEAKEALKLASPSSSCKDVMGVEWWVPSQYQFPELEDGTEVLSVEKEVQGIFSVESSFGQVSKASIQSVNEDPLSFIPESPSSKDFLSPSFPPLGSFKK